MTRMFVRSVVFGSLLGTVALSMASDVIGIRVNLGYHITSDFKLRNNDRKSISGPEIGADFPLAKFPGIQVFASPSIVLGGQLIQGSDVDGTIYRFMVTARQTLSKAGLYSGFSAGVAHSISRGQNEFKSASGFVTSVTLGMPLKTKLLGITPSIEGRYYLSSKDQFKGFSIGISASF